MNRYELFWPLSVRQIHYYLLNDPPLKHASKPHSVYVNDRKSYQSLDELTVRARLQGYIPMDAIDDDTRPIVVWDVHDDVQGYIRRDIRRLFMGYARDLLQSQPNHIEIIGEKLTIKSIIQPIAEENCIPFALGRGYGNLPIRAKMLERFEESGKEKLVILFLSDFDADGDEIVHSFARSMRDDFDIDEDLLVPIKVALTHEQVQTMDLQTDEMSEAKPSSPNYQKFVAKYGSNRAYELEALKPEDMQKLLKKAIDSVIDTDAFNDEIDEEQEDAAFLAGRRERVLEALEDDLE